MKGLTTAMADHDAAPDADTTAPATTTPDQPAAPTPDEVGAMYDEFGDMLAMTLGGAAVHVGMLVPHDTPVRRPSLVDLADLAQDRQTDFYIDTLDAAGATALLDIGCGTGGPAVRLAQRTGARVTGITVSQRQLAQGRERASAANLSERVTFERGNAMDLTYADASFDAAWSIDCFAHLSDRPAGLREARRVIRPGGRFLLTEFTRRGTPPADEEAAFTRLWASPPPTTFSTLLTEVEEAGYEVLKVEDMTPNSVLAGELMCLLYQDRRTELEERYGKELMDQTDALIGPYRRFCRTYLEHHMLVLRTPEA
ncbi:class I SAM-dependent methyltransferase [Streptomyces sp. 71268]|uniref:SAM-dependent methyltransferase n=1 Tax=Streptomyces sp. 71268 TaxID=3002640 RepID=UPI0023F9F092|nr:class I SAM-dependent methyltransferase [Streptomyces sp. 71268]WEV23786.1 class I SAM-dependent methyltransferase [Streptomyces sp. 71268]